MISPITIIIISQIGYQPTRILVIILPPDPMASWNFTDGRKWRTQHSIQVSSFCAWVQSHHIYGFPLCSDTTSAFASANSWGDLSPAEIQRDFVQYNNLPMGVMHHGDRLFITLPRRRTGMPATIAYVRTNFPRSSSPALQAYPNFRTNQLPVSLRSPLQFALKFTSNVCWIWLFSCVLCRVDDSQTPIE